ncbi:hypothetical protein V8C44DRAFT_330390 [Trichoderma aethiopicum]
MHHHLHHHFLMSFLFLPETRTISIIHSRPPLPLIRPVRPSALKPLTLTSESSHPLLSKSTQASRARKPRIGPKPRHHDHRPVTPQMPVAYTTPRPHTHRKDETGEGGWHEPRGARLGKRHSPAIFPALLAVTQEPPRRGQKKKRR